MFTWTYSWLIKLTYGQNTKFMFHKHENSKVKLTEKNSSGVEWRSGKEECYIPSNQFSTAYACVPHGH